MQDTESLKGSLPPLEDDGFSRNLPPAQPNFQGPGARPQVPAGAGYQSGQPNQANATDPDGDGDNDTMEGE